jgi:hypothetical protein
MPRDDVISPALPYVKAALKDMITEPYVVRRKIYDQCIKGEIDRLRYDIGRHYRMI